MTSLTNAAATGATAALIAAPPDPSLPTEWVIGCAIVGALLSVWTQAAAADLSARALAGLVGRFASSVAFGIGGTTFVVTVGPSYEWMEPLSHAPHWVLSLMLAGFAQWLIPVIGGFINRKSHDA